MAKIEAREEKLRKSKQQFAIARVRDVILEEEHLTELVQMVNEELAVSLESTTEELRSAKEQATRTRTRQQSHHDALQTRSLDLHDLAPRIRELREALDASETCQPIALSRSAIQGYVSKLHETLLKGTLSERKQVLTEILESITVAAERVVLEYRLSYLKQETGDTGSPVLSAVRSSGAWGTECRTRSLVVAW